MRCGGRPTLFGLCMLIASVVALPATLTATPLARRQVLQVLPLSDGRVPIDSKYSDGLPVPTATQMSSASPSPSGLVLGNGTSPGFLQSPVGGSGMSWGQILGIVGGIVGLAGMSCASLILFSLANDARRHHHEDRNLRCASAPRRRAKPVQSCCNRTNVFVMPHYGATAHAASTAQSRRMVTNVPETRPLRATDIAAHSSAIAIADSSPVARAYAARYTSAMPMIEGGTATSVLHWPIGGIEHEKASTSSSGAASGSLQCQPCSIRATHKIAVSSSAGNDPASTCRASRRMRSTYGGQRALKRGQVHDTSRDGRQRQPVGLSCRARQARPLRHGRGARCSQGRA